MNRMTEERLEELQFAAIGGHLQPPRALVECLT